MEMSLNKKRMKMDEKQIHNTYFTLNKDEKKIRKKTTIDSLEIH